MLLFSLEKVNIFVAKYIESQHNNDEMVEMIEEIISF